ncbi:hypothetical protein I8752_08570 [Nostocaceae cyanobacterium CENA369]|uniref:Uncharacterized protein n=1 Tax=Dendronalium phyllosphericum CENA369 TaxID=1725256 RepID=A0A8J7LCP9_9NOST|nr:hypothetical protein [Dendronalium phyllosphericum]MBH8573067.1 hypothetical protein [Dendronalium phyllosphericum CENA369]
MESKLENISNSPKRRQILQTALTFMTGLTTTSFISFLRPKSTEKAQAIVVQRPNEFELKGKGTQIKYSILNDVPQLNYRTQKTFVRFNGDDISRLTTDIGTLVTVILSKPNPNVGGNIVKFSFLLPTINLPIGDGETAVQTQAVLTTEKTSGLIRRPIFGQFQSYETFILNGTARYR